MKNEIKNPMERFISNTEINLFGDGGVSDCDGCDDCNNPAPEKPGHTGMFICTHCGGEFSVNEQNYVDPENTVCNACYAKINNCFVCSKCGYCCPCSFESAEEGVCKNCYVPSEPDPVLPDSPEDDPTDTPSGGTTDDPTDTEDTDTPNDDPSFGNGGTGFICADCGEYCPCGNKCIDNEGREVCMFCYRNPSVPPEPNPGHTGQFICSDCGRTFDRDEQHYIDPNTTVCNSCFVKYDRFICTECLRDCPCSKRAYDLDICYECYSKLPICPDCKQRVPKSDRYDDKTNFCKTCGKKQEQSPKISVESITLDKKSLIMFTGEFHQCVATVAPENASVKTLLWTSSDEEVASVDLNTGYVSAKNVGVATITAHACDGSVTNGSLLIDVKKPIDALRPRINSYIYVDTVDEEEAILKDNNGENIIVGPSNEEVLPLKKTELIQAGDKEFCQVLYNGMIGYVLADNFTRVVIATPEFEFEREVTAIPRYNITMNIYSSANSDAEVEGNFVYGDTLLLVNDVPQRGGWYAVYGESTDKTHVFGWCEGKYLEYPTLITKTATQIRTTPYTDNDNFMKDSELNLIWLQPNQTVRLIQNQIVYESDVDGNGWFKIEYEGDVGYVSVDCFVKAEAGEFLTALPGDKTPFSIHTIINSIRNCPTTILHAGVKDVAVAVTLALARAEYSLPFIAGIIGNIVHEATAGQFENCYTNFEDNQDYMQYMISNYAYDDKYNGKNICDVDVLEVYNILNSLNSESNGQWRIGEGRVGFGLGCIQWTFVRTLNLVKRYLDINKYSEVITKEQVIQAEVMHMIYELRYDYYKYYVIDIWKNSNNAGAAYEAGEEISHYYIGQFSPEIKKQRGNSARLVYQEIFM